MSILVVEPEDIGAIWFEATVVDSSASAVPIVVSARGVGLTIGERGATACGLRRAIGDARRAAAARIEKATGRLRLGDGTSVSSDGSILSLPPLTRSVGSTRVRIHVACGFWSVPVPVCDRVEISYIYKV